MDLAWVQLEHIKTWIQMVQVESPVEDGGAVTPTMLLSQDLFHHEF